MSQPERSTPADAVTTTTDAASTGAGSTGRPAVDRASAEAGRAARRAPHPRAPRSSHAPARRRPFALLGSELALVFRRRRTWAMLGALASSRSSSPSPSG